MALVFTVGGIAAVVGLALGFFVGRGRARRRAERELEVVRSGLHTELTAVRVDLVRLEERRTAATSEADRLRSLETELRSTLALAEQEKARIEFELRHVTLAASRVPELEARLVALEALRVELALAEARLVELEPMSSELDLRNQFIDSLQRELGYRDERLIALELRMDQLRNHVALVELADSVLELDTSVDGTGTEQEIDLTKEPATSSTTPDRSIDDTDIADTDIADTDIADAAGSNVGVIRLIRSSDDDQRDPPVTRALAQALRGLGLESFQELPSLAQGHGSSDAV